jgi:hypothetical protein
LAGADIIAASDEDEVGVWVVSPDGEGSEGEEMNRLKEDGQDCKCLFP